MEEDFTTKKSLTTKYGLTDSDFEQIKAHGISLDKIEGELFLYELGIPKICLDKPATVDDGIVKLTLEEIQNYASLFDKEKSNLKLKKFVPASGAASRMFKFLSEFLMEFDHENETINAYINRKKDKNLPVFLAGIEKFPFYEVVKAKLKQQLANYYSLEGHEKSYHFIKLMLDSNHFDFANMPKGAFPEGE